MPRNTKAPASPSPSQKTAPELTPSEEFTQQTLTFLRGLARNNDRDWFEARREIYQQSLRTPMLSLIAKVNGLMEAFAPLHVRPPEKTVLRIYRDTRFSKNKLPYKQSYAAWWGRTGMEKTSGAGFYFQLSAKHIHIAAGLYMPDAAQTLLVRRHLLEHHKTFRALIAAKPVHSRMQLADPRALTRLPKGFAPDHPANDLVVYRNWGVDVELDAGQALQPRFAVALAGYFRAAAPLVDFLNTPLTASVPVARRPLF